MLTRKAPLPPDWRLRSSGAAGRGAQVRFASARPSSRALEERRAASHVASLRVRLLPWQVVRVESTARIRLQVAGVDTLALSALCASCPQGPRGCCAAPPVFTWADIARILGHGGQDWLRGEVAARRLLPNARGLAVARVGDEGDGGARCAFHGARGCTLSPERRSGTCNDYLCDDALVDGARTASALAGRADEVHRELAAIYARWDTEMAAAIGTPCWDGGDGEAALLALIASYAPRVRASLPRRLRR